mmetsp:Transcript_25062/g.27794  ORF Transcript_25062/g.27794 Transcript_25062/m.27794 type:complete len:85 (-) Transcript_25062:36-290(-)
MRTKRLSTPKVSQDIGAIKTSTIKPKLLESNVLNQQKFFSLSNGFQKVFANDKKELNMVIPIAGYKGHTRGQRSQNFFGRSFRE